MATPSFTIFEDITIFDVVWVRVSDDLSVGPTGPGQLDDEYGTFTVERAPPAASSSTSQIPSTPSIPMIATFDWGHWSANFACNYDQTKRTYDNFDLVAGSMSAEFAGAFYSAHEFNNDAQPDISDCGEGVWKLEMETMYSGMDPQYVELWAKKRVQDVQALATDSDLREWSLDQYASGGEEEDESGTSGEQEDESGTSGEEDEEGTEEDEGEKEAEGGKEDGDEGGAEDEDKSNA